MNQIKWAISGGILIKDGLIKFDPYKENFQNDVFRKSNHTGIGFDKEGKIKMFIKENFDYDPCPPARLVKTATNLNLVGAIFLDGGGSSQMYYKKPIVKSDRKIITAILLKAL